MGKMDDLIEAIRMLAYVTVERELRQTEADDPLAMTKQLMAVERRLYDALGFTDEDGEEEGWMFMPNSRKRHFFYEAKDPDDGSVNHKLLCGKHTKRFDNYFPMDRNDDDPHNCWNCKAKLEGRVWAKRLQDRKGTRR